MGGGGGGPGTSLQTREMWFYCFAPLYLFLKFKYNLSKQTNKILARWFRQI